MAGRLPFVMGDDGLPQRMQAGDSLNGAAAFDDGCYRISVASTTTLKLSPLNGNTLWVGGQACTIPSSGITYTASGLSASTLYYVYATASGGAVNALVLSTTGHITGADGREYLSSGGSTPSAVTTSRLIGMVYTNTAAAPFTVVWCANYFNRRNVASANAEGSVTSSSNTTTLLVNGPGFLTWGDDAGSFSFVGTGYSATAGGGLSIQLGFDGSPTSEAVFNSCPVANSYVGLVLPYPNLLNEGFHNLQLYGRNGGSGNTSFNVLGVLYAMTRI